MVAWQLSALILAIAIVFPGFAQPLLFGVDPDKSRTLSAVYDHTFFVSPTGSDSNDGSELTPFQTLAKAKAVIAAGGYTGTMVYLRGGTYPVPNQFYFDASVNGTAEKPNIFANYPGETPVFSAAVATTVSGGGVKTVNLTSLGITDPVQAVYVNGIRQTLARTPNRAEPNFSAIDPWTGTLAHVAGSTPDMLITECPGKVGDTKNYCVIRYTSGTATGQLNDVDNWPSDITTARAVVLTGGDTSGTTWTQQQLGIASQDIPSGTLVLSQATSYQLRPNHTFYLEGAPEFLDADSEWAQAGDTLSIKLPSGSSTTDVTIVAYTPGSGTDAVSNQFVVSGQHIHLQGLTVNYSGESYAIRVQDADQVVLNNLSIRGSDGVGILVAGTSKNVTIKNSRITDVVGVGINVAPEPNFTFLKNLTLSNILVENNYIWDIGTTGTLRYWTSAGIIANRTGTTVRNNTVRNTFGAAIGGGAGSYTVIDKNAVYNSNMLRADTGAISFVSIFSGSTRSWIPRGHQITGNYINETGGYSWNPANSRHEYGYYSWGVYLDDWTSDTLVSGNIIVRPHIDCVMIHGGRMNTITKNLCYADKELESMIRLREDHHNGYDGSEDPKWSEVQNMLAAGFNQSAHLAAFPDLLTVPRFPGRGELQTNNTVSSNVLVSSYVTPPRLYEVYRLSPSNTFSNNTIWSTQAAPFGVYGSLNTTPDGLSVTWNTFADWLAAGFDAGSQYADPLISDPSVNNFTLSSGSPALSKGYLQINQAAIGAQAIAPTVASVTPTGPLTIGEAILSTWVTTSQPAFPVTTTESQLRSGSPSGTIISDWTAASGSSTSYSSTDLTIGTSYFVCIRARNDAINPLNGSRGEWSTPECSQGVTLTSNATPTPTATPTESVQETPQVTASSATPLASLPAKTSSTPKTSPSSGKVTPSPISPSTTEVPVATEAPTSSPSPNQIQPDGTQATNLNSPAPKISPTTTPETPPTSPDNSVRNALILVTLTILGLGAGTFWYIRRLI